MFWTNSALIGPMILYPNVYVMGVLLACMLFMTPSANAVLIGFQVAVTPDRLQGRVISSMRLIISLGAPLGAPLSRVSSLSRREPLLRYRPDWGYEMAAAPGESMLSTGGTITIANRNAISTYVGIQVGFGIPTKASLYDVLPKV